MVNQVVAADARILRAVAHPLRGALLYELHARGASTVSRLAAAVGQPVNSVSFHLGMLSKYGVIEAAPELATDKRQRWWRASDQGLAISFDEIEGERGGKAALEIFKQHSVAWWHALIDRFFNIEGVRDEIRSIHDVPMYLTKAEAKRVDAEVVDLLQRWSKHGREAAQREQSPEAAAHGSDAGLRRTYLGLVLVMPHPPDVVKQ
ncbi:MAG: ArsR/SmtB family transcription factor [Nocardioidaceae bacterium]